MSCGWSCSVDVGLCGFRLGTSRLVRVGNGMVWFDYAVFGAARAFGPVSSGLARCAMACVGGVRYGLFRSLLAAARLGLVVCAHVGSCVVWYGALCSCVVRSAVVSRGCASAGSVRRGRVWYGRESAGLVRQSSLWLGTDCPAQVWFGIAVLCRVRPGAVRARKRRSGKERCGQVGSGMVVLGEHR